MDFFKCLARASVVYAPVHTLPVLLFKLKALQQRPVQVASSVGIAILRSTLFLDLYQVIVKVCVAGGCGWCVWRACVAAVRGQLAGATVVVVEVVVCGPVFTEPVRGSALADVGC